jgi:hypothetical protein
MHHLILTSSCKPAHAQTETPEQLRQRNSARKPGQKVVSVVERQAVAVLSRGTLMDPEMVAGHPDAAYVLAGERALELRQNHIAGLIMRQNHIARLV